ncbi:C-myc promoter-binding protein isoform X2 [Octopus sinensis]|uniref:C-myc promoter-binding protein isoform X2 n=1 Tax=Octopus sinensis TaxID=2607531 RepID=A0A6P7SZN6_9MOLL|nr:C-myc promoter-binding protein isoform X2 [Octopus sinensis]
MDERRVADYFVVAGLPETPSPLEESTNESIIKQTHKQDPITDICVINKSLAEKEPKGYVCLERTQTGFLADLNHGSIRCSEMYICYRRGREKPPLTDIGVLYEGKEKLMSGCEIVHTTAHGHSANVNNSNSSRIYITYRRASDMASSDTLAVVDICIILTNKNESAPHAYCQINKNLNKGMMGSDVYLCYKKAMTKTDVLAYKPAILGRFPEADYDNYPLPESVPLFCLPMGATIECWPAKAQHPLPVFSTFILTTCGGEKAYGAAVSFYEEFPEEKLTDFQLRHLGLKNKHIREQYRIPKTVHSNKCICLLSRWPFFDAFKKFLSYLYRISITGPYNVPIERHISHFMFDVPYPSPQRPRILVQLNHEALSLSMPEDSPLPQSGASFITLLKDLGPENCMTILLHVLLEQKILIHSLRPAVLTGVAEAVTTMIFPLHWQCPYIPLCPLGLSGVLSAPCPFIVGIDSRYFDLYSPPPDVVCVDLDTNTIWFDDKKVINSKLLPKKPARVLQDTLHKIFNQLSAHTSTTPTPDEVSLELAPIDYDFKVKQKETMIELQIQEAFLRFMACLMKGYKTFLQPIMWEPTASTTKAASLFDMQGFLKSRDKAYLKFFSLLIKTQTFIRFIEERSFVSDKDVSLAFFDECTEKVEDTKDEPQLIDFDDSHKSERTVFILPPEPSGLPEGATYSYNGFPELKPELFLLKKASTSSLAGKQSACPNSPIAKRTKQEVRMAQKIAQQQVGSPDLWAKCLLGHCYCLWFIHLPAFVKLSQSKPRALRLAYDILQKMNTIKDIRPDEVCYRVVLQLCGQYNEPTLAVMVLCEMKRVGVQPNAITYGYYNKAVLESKWPSDTKNGLLLWKKLRNVITAIAQLRKGLLHQRSSTAYCYNSESDYDQVSHTSNDSCIDEAAVSSTDANSGGTTGNRIIAKADLGSDMVVTCSNKVANEERMSTALANSNSSDSSHSNNNFIGSQFRTRVGSIMRRSAKNITSTESIEALKTNLFGSSAGVLMVSDSILKNNNFNYNLHDLEMEAKRKRHKSAGDNHLKTRSNSMFSNWRPSWSSANAFSMRFSDLTKKEKVSETIEQKTVETCLLANPSIEDSGIILDEANQNEAVQQLPSEKEPSKEATPTDETDSKSTTKSPTKSSIPLSSSFSAPITENDPLGLFDNNVNESEMNNNSSPVSPTKPSSSFSKKSLVQTISPERILHDIRASNLCSTLHEEGMDDEDLVNIRYDTGNRKLGDLGRTSSSPDCLADSVKANFNHQTPQKKSKISSTLSLDEAGKVDRSQDTKLRRTNSLRRRNEMLSGVLKSASLVLNKLNELKQSITQPGHSGSNLSLTPSEDRDSGTGDEDNHDGLSGLKQRMSGSLDFLSRTDNCLNEALTENRRQSSHDSISSPTFTGQDIPMMEFSDSSTKSTSTDSYLSYGLFDFFEKMGEITIEVEMTSCCRCPHCLCLLYDEEIMAGWSADDSNLNTSCTFCAKKLVPRIQIFIKDARKHLNKGTSPVKGQDKSSSVFGSPRKDKSNAVTTESSEKSKTSSNPPSQRTSISSTFSCDKGDNDETTSEEGTQNSVQSESQECVNECSPECETISSEASNEQSSTDVTTDSCNNNNNKHVKSNRYRSTSECLTAFTSSSAVYSSLYDDKGSNLESPTSCPSTATTKTGQQELRNSTLSSEIKRDFISGKSIILEPITFPYLSPLVLRKELENVVESDGDLCLLESNFVDEHPIIFWNMVWYFRRIAVPCHLSGLVLKSKMLKSLELDEPVNNGMKLNSRNVSVRTMWDNVKMNDEMGLPMYMAWRAGRASAIVDALVTDSQIYSRPLMQQIISNIHVVNDMLTPIKLLADARRRKSRKGYRRSFYREILFLAFVACGKNVVDLEGFDRAYRAAFSKLSKAEINRLQLDDAPLPLAVRYCRAVFEELEV